MSVYKKLGISFVSYIFLGWFICQPLLDVGVYKPYNKMSSNGHEISASELNSFLDVWAKMVQSPIGDKVSLKSLKSKRHYPRMLKSWLKLHNWDTERFFYDEQRIRDLMEYIDAKQHLEDNRKISKTSYINLNDIISNLEKRIETKSFNEDELELIENNKYQISEILAGRAILGKK